MATPASATSWSLFNAEDKVIASAVYVTYSTLTDMLNAANRTGETFLFRFRLAAA